MKQDNRGLSLVELIVVIAIMAIMVGLGVLSVNLIFGTQARTCAQKVSGMLNETKTGCLSRFDETMTIAYYTKGQDGKSEFTADGYYAVNKVYTINKDAASIQIGTTDSAEIRPLGSKNVEIHVYLSDGSDFILGTTKKLTISFKRSTGAFKTAMVDGADTGAYIEKITFSSGLKTYTMTMVHETGTHTVEG